MKIHISIQFADDEPEILTEVNSFEAAAEFLGKYERMEENKIKPLEDF